MEPYRTHALIPEIDAATLSWYCLSYNPSPGAIALLAANPDKVEWTSLCCNPSLDARLTALLATQKKYELSWSALSRNRSPAALEFLFAPENRANIDWEELSGNPAPAAIEMLIAHPDEIYWWRAFAYLDSAVFALIDACLRAPGYQKDGWRPYDPRRKPPPPKNKGNVTLYDAGWRVVSSDPRPEALALLAAYPEMVDYKELSKNPAPEAVRLLLANRDKIYWPYFSTNPNPDAVALLRATPERVLFVQLAHNTHPDAIALLAESLAAGQIYRVYCVQKIDMWINLARNPSPAALPLLETMMGEVGGWLNISISRNRGDAAAAMLAAHPERIDWTALSANPSPGAVALLAAHPDRVDWEVIMTNESPAAKALFARHAGGFAPGSRIGKIRCRSPAIFEVVYDYAAMRAAMDVHREALAAAAFHPRRLARHLALGGEPEEF